MACLPLRNITNIHECMAGHTIMYICPKIWAFFLGIGLELDRTGWFDSDSSIKRVNFGTMGRELIVFD